MDVDGSELDVVVVRPDRLQQLLSREYALRVFEEVAEQGSRL